MQVAFNSWYLFSSPVLNILRRNLAKESCCGGHLPNGRGDPVLVSSELEFSEVWGSDLAPRCFTREMLTASSPTLILAWVWHRHRSPNLRVPPWDAGRGRLPIDWVLHPAGFTWRQSVGQCCFQSLFADSKYSSRAPRLSREKAAQGTLGLQVDLDQLVPSSHRTQAPPSCDPVPAPVQLWEHTASVLCPLSCLQLLSGPASTSI